MGLSWNNRELQLRTRKLLQNHRKLLKKHQVMPPRAPNGTLHGKDRMGAWPFSGLRRVSDPAAFQMILVATLLATVVGDCGPPPNLHFASPVIKLNETNFKTGTVLKYNCRPGYSRTSSRNHITCQVGGSWGHSTFCVKKRCRNPGELQNGQVIVKTDYSFGSQIEFSCSEGYILIGPTTSHCEIQDKGVDWSDDFPQCVIVKCEPPPAIHNGRHSGGDEDFYPYGSSVTYSCDPNFSLLGQASISCTVENKTIGVWSQSPPTCKKISCVQPEHKNGKIVSGFGPIYTYKDSIVFDCNRGYILKGSSLIHCEADNNWDPVPPTCEINSCTDLPYIPHASWDVYGYNQPTKKEVYEIGTVLRYRCHLGYKPAVDKPTTVSCQGNLEWSPHVACEETCCPVPHLKNGKITLSRKSGSNHSCDYFYRDVVSYTCYEKYEFEANCREDGTWNPKTPTCDENCDFPPIIAHGRHKRVQTYSLFKTEVAYECDRGYTLVGPARLSCSASHWSPEAPQCKAVCVKPEIANGRLTVIKNQYSEPDTVTVQCNSGYGLVGSPNITCSESRTWYPEVPRCEWVYPEGCEQVLVGRALMQCLPNPEDVKLALEVYKLSLEVELLERQRDNTKRSTP